MMDRVYKVGAVLFDGFELLDVFGPAEVFGEHKCFEFVVVAEEQGHITSAQGPRVVVDFTFEHVSALDIVLVPGGPGTRNQVNNRILLNWLVTTASNIELLVSVCTGAGVLAAAGLLDGRRATSNKQAWSWIIKQGENVDWVPEARWIEDGNVVTSAGVAAGIDMALAIVARFTGERSAECLANAIEYEWHRDANRDPFARRAGLT